MKIISWIARWRIIEKCGKVGGAIGFANRASYQITRSSNGRTLGFGPRNRGSNPCRVAVFLKIENDFLGFLLRNAPALPARFLTIVT